MKTIVSAVAAAVIGFAVAYAFVSSQSEARLKQERAAYAAEKLQLEAALAAAEHKPAKVQTIEIPAAAPVKAVASAKLTPQEILDRLVLIHPGSRTNRAYAIRTVIYYLQMLRDDGADSLQPINRFFAKNVDVDYSVEDDGTISGNGPGRGNRGGRGFAFGFRRGQQLRTDFVLPPSLRLGLVDVLKQIGGADAEKILANVLSTTGRGVEVAYIARSLEEMAPGQYRKLALTAAKDLLQNLPTIDDPNRYDENAKGYLYSVLEMYNDTSFVAKAQALLVSPDGTIDRDAMNYLTQTLKDQAVAVMYAAYNDPRITNQFDRTLLANQVLGYAGQNPQANALFGEIVGNNDLNMGLRAVAVMRLAGGGGGPQGGDSPTDPQIITARMQLLAALKPSITDERLSRALDMTSQNLQNLLEGKPVENFGGGGGGFGRRFGQGGGGGGGGGGRRNGRGGQQQQQQDIPVDQ